MKGDHEIANGPDSDHEPKFTVIFVPRDPIAVHVVTDVELEALRSGSESPNLAFLGMTSGAALSTLTTLMTTSLDGPVGTMFLGGCIGTSGLSMFFIWRVWHDRRMLRELIATIRRPRSHMPLNS